MRIWEVDCAPGLYAFPQDTKPPECRQCVLEIVRTILEENRIEIRRYFLDSGGHNHWVRSQEQWPGEWERKAVKTTRPG